MLSSEIVKQLSEQLTRQSEQINRQNDIIKQHVDANKELIKVIETLKDDKYEEASGSDSPQLGAGRKIADMEYLMETLSKSMTDFVFDPESNSTFESWYKRYTKVFENAKLGESRKIELLLRKFDNKTYTRYANVILPKTPDEFSFDETIKQLKELYGHEESVFSIRHRCMQMRKIDSMNIYDYQALVNNAAEEFKFSEMTIDQFKCLIFVNGLTSQSDVEIRVRLLTKFATNTELKLKDLVAEYKRLALVKTDSTTVQNRPVDSKAQVNKVSSQKKQSTDKNASCWNCGSKTRHPRSDCPAKNAQCKHCNLIGHFVKYCKKRKQALNQESESKDDDKKSEGDQSKPKKDKQNKQSKQGKVNSICVNQINSSDRKFINVSINDQPIQLQIDSAADVTVVSRKTCKKLGLKYRSTSIQPNDASGNTLNLIGEASCNVSFRDKSIVSTIYISKSSNLNVFGIDLIKKFNLWEVPFADICTENRVHQIIQPNTYAEFLKQHFPSCFESTLGKCVNFQAHLQLKKDAHPPFIKNRPVPFAIQPQIETELRRLESLGVISSTTTAKCAAPIVVIQKKTGDIRICADFSTGLNEALEDHHYPLPLPEDIFAKLNGSKYFSHIDLSDAFLQIEVDDQSKELLIINTHIGLFKYNRLSFGIKTAPTIFQQVMDQLSKSLKGVVTYMDDIFVHGHTKEAHDKALIRLMTTVKEHGLRIKLSKCKFALTEINYLGSVINKHGLKPDPARIEAICTMPKPTNITELRSFLGVINFYNKFINGMHNLRAPLDDLLKKDTTWSWNKSCQQAFNQLKKSLSSELLLTHYNPNLEIIISSDASNKGIGACIQHKMTDNSIRPIAYASRTYQPAEKNYSQIEKEALSIIFAVQKFHKFIFGRKFTLQTDHKPLISIFGSKKGIPVYTANRLQRWAIILLAYDFNIQYINTESFAYADFLSRLITQQSRDDDETVIASIRMENHILQIINANLQRFPVNYEQLVQSYNNDSSMEQLKSLVTTNWKNFSSDDPELKQFFNRRENLTISNDIVLFNDRIVIPVELRSKLLQQLHVGHPGIVRMKNLARSFVYWPNIDRDIEAHISTCSNCALSGKSPTKTLLHSWPKTSQPWERIHIDYAGPFKNSNFLIVIDAHTKWPEIIRTTSTTSTKTISILSSIFARFGTPLQIVSDNGTQFTSEQFQTFCNINGIEHLRTSPFHPQSNGQAERFVDTFKRSIAKLQNDGNLDENLEVFLKTYRTTPNDNCPARKSPAEVMFGRKIRTVFDLLKPTERPSSERNLKMEAQYNKKHGAKSRKFDVNDMVYVQIHKNNKWQWEEGVVKNKVGAVNYTISTDHRDIQAHANQLKKRFSESKQNSEVISIPTLLDLFEIEENQPSTTDTLSTNEADPVLSSNESPDLNNKMDKFIDSLSHLMNSLIT